MLLDFVDGYVVVAGRQAHQHVVPSRRVEIFIHLTAIRGSRRRVTGLIAGLG